MTTKAETTVITVIVGAVVGIVVLVVAAASAWYRNDPGRDEVGLWCRTHNGTLPGNSGPVAELAWARSGNGNVMAAAFNEAPFGQKVEDRFAPEPIRDVAHRFGQGIVDSLKDPAKLNDPTLDADAATMQDWIRVNCVGPDRTGP